MFTKNIKLLRFFRQRIIYDEANFMKKLSVLMQEGYPFVDSVFMLLPHHTKKLTEIELKIERMLSDGKAIYELFTAFRFSKKYMMTLQLAEHNGAFIEALQAIAKQMEQHQKNRQNILKLIAYPMFLFLLLIGVFIAFRTVFLPNMSQLYTTQNNQNDQWFELSISKFLLHLPDFLMLLLCITFIISSIFLWFFLKKDAHLKLKLLLKIPFFSTLIKLLLTKQFAFELGMLLKSGLPLQQSIEILMQQSFQPFIQYVAKTIYTDILMGQSLSICIQQQPYFLADFYMYAAHGEKGGTLGKELIVFSEFLQEREQNALNMYLKILQPLLFVIIAVCILGAYLSIMLPMYDMMNYV